jgi:hypothetical protein
VVFRHYLERALRAPCLVLRLALLWLALLWLWLWLALLRLWLARRRLRLAVALCLAGRVGEAADGMAAELGGHPFAGQGDRHLAQPHQGRRLGRDMAATGNRVADQAGAERFPEHAKLG